MSTTTGSTASTVDKTKTAAELIAEKKAAGTASRTEEEIAASKPLFSRYDRGDTVAQQKMLRALMVYAPTDPNDTKIFTRLRAEQLTQEEAKKVATDADDRRDKVEGPLKQYDAVYAEPSVSAAGSPWRQSCREGWELLLGRSREHDATPSWSIG